MRATVFVATFWTALLASLPVPGLEAGEVRTFKSKSGDGRELVAEVIRVDAAEVQVRRTSDGKSFAIPINSLSAEDQQFLKQLRARQPADAAAAPVLPVSGWKKARFHVPLSVDSVVVIGMGSALRLTGAKTYEGYVPVGAWMYFYTKRSKDVDQAYIYNLVRYDGASEWYLDFREGKIYRSYQPGGPEQVIAAGIPELMAAGFVADLQQENLAEAVSITALTENAARALGGFKHPVAGLRLSGKLANSNNQIVSASPQAYYGGGDDSFLELLAGIPTLQCLCLTEPTGAGWSDSAIDKLAGLPELSTIQVIRSQPVKTLDIFEKFPSLRHLHLMGRVRTKVKLLKHPGLESLNLSGIFRIDPDTLSGLPELRFLNVSGIDSDFQSQKNLRSLSVSSAGGAIDVQIESGDCHELRYLAVTETADFSKTPKLHTLRLLSSPTISDVAKAPPELRRLELFRLTPGQLGKICRLPNLRNLESIAIRFSPIEDFSELANLPNLRVISMFTIKESAAELDLSLFPKLERLEITRAMEIETVSGIQAHPSLVHLELNQCARLLDLGKPAPNHTLETLILTGADRLEDLEPFHQCTGLKGIRLWGNDNLAAPLLLDQTNELEYLYLFDNGAIPSNEKPY